MNRVIKFRGFNEKWHYGYYIKAARSLINGDIAINLGQAEICSYIVYTENGKLNIVEVDEKSVGEFTKLLDVNGKEVFEGDIVKFERIFESNNSEPDVGLLLESEYKTVITIAEVKISPLIGVYSKLRRGISKFKKKKDYEVIGNVYQNPELLESNV